MKTVCMKVSTDELSLPEAIANSFSELAKICGITEKGIYAARNRYNKGQLKYEKYIKVVIDDEE